MPIILDKLSFLNKEIDQVTIGLPSLDTLNNDQPDERPFIYSEFLPAGHHQFVIYDPEHDQFYMHDFFLDINKEEITYTTQK